MGQRRLFAFGSVVHSEVHLLQEGDTRAEFNVSYDMDTVLEMPGDPAAVIFDTIEAALEDMKNASLMFNNTMVSVDDDAMDDFIEDLESISE